MDLQLAKASTGRHLKLTTGFAFLFFGLAALMMAVSLMMPPPVKAGQSHTLGLTRAIAAPIGAPLQASLISAGGTTARPDRF